MFFLKKKKGKRKETAFFNLIIPDFFKILENFEKFIFTKHLISMLDICLQIISPCVMQHVWFGPCLSRVHLNVWMFLPCIILSVRVSSSWRFGIPVIVCRRGQKNIVWRSLKILLIKLALSLFFKDQPEALLHKHRGLGLVT